MIAARPPALSILIATHGRVDSLREVLTGLAACRADEDYEVVVIDNACEPPLTAAALQTPGLGALRILREMRRGKPHALNRAFDEGGLGDVVAVIDDDMSPPPDWIPCVLSATRRLPQFDIFSGKSHVVWPAGVAKPAWADDPLAQGMLFSTYDTGSNADVEFGNGAAGFPSGNCYWFRRSVLDRSARYPHAALLYEAQFILQLMGLGHRGVFVPEVSIGHRIQEGLVSARRFQERARVFGRELAEFELRLAAERVGGALARVRSRLRPLRALVQLGGWSMKWLLAGLRPEKTRIPARARALWGIEHCRARLRPPATKARVAEAPSRGGEAASPGRIVQ